MDKNRPDEPLPARLPVCYDTELYVIPGFVFPV